MSRIRLTPSICQLCGFLSDDICSFRMWYECDDNDRPEKDKVIVACRGCERVIQDHPRLYQQIEWGMGDAGHFILVCENCQWRKGIDCANPKLKKNGGDGLKLEMSRPLGDIMIHFHTENGGLTCGTGGFTPFTDCEGLRDGAMP